ncbi:hypothetical protein LCG56_29210 (plasmid) [Pseudomonas cannabina pv. alisalensis]|uniref:RNase NYN domain-containing protein n=1 Tax=Pseudomonas syringae pv. maculicola str. ES4326 TaxID=629265 RepID=A0A8T8CA32_PSEYM|nr:MULTISPECIES: hypothetical protein [Pseudomonas syringae group]QHF00471.1 hypothetical protein PMA4326_028555 [Pseudomonas syringae pv. maculicola str. ES4326]UBZ00448.1 hypothetical protein LCG56_29210 [Pseudomonas cannabina pv. alisalensis]
MELNPYRKRFEAASAALLVAKKNVEDQHTLLGWLHSFNEVEAKESLELARARVVTIQKELNSNRLDMRCLQSWAPLTVAESIKLRLFGTIPRPKYDPNAKVDPERESKICELEVELKVQKGAVEKIFYQIQFIKTLDWLEADAEIATYTRQVADLEPDVAKLRADARRFDEYLVEPLLEMKKLASELALAVEAQESAAKFVHRLKTAPDASSRRTVQQQCFNLFGVDDANKAVRIKTAQVESLQRNLTKVEIRIAELQQRESRGITRLVIDGTNLCYRGRNPNRKFIGVVALTHLVPTLQQLWPGVEIIICFDPGTLKNSAKLWPDGVKHFHHSVQIHEIAQGNKADETIIELASGDTEYVISNDTFRDFQNRPPVKEGRVFKADITTNDILVLALAAHARFGSSQQSPSTAAGGGVDPA